LPIAGAAKHESVYRAKSVGCKRLRRIVRDLANAPGALWAMRATQWRARV
jgi:hypothetical protein